MKITPKQYAAALFLGIRGKNKDEQKAATKRFAGILAFNNDLSLADKITREFEKIWDKEHGIVQARIISARELDKPTVRLLNGRIADLARAKEVQSLQSTDKSLLGGVVLEYGDKILDGSLKTRLNNLKEAMVK